MTNKNKKYVYSHALGCKVNSYESFCAEKAFIEYGYESTTDFKKADIIILNTCSVTSRADQKSRQFISRFRRNNPNTVLIVMGCSMQSFGDKAIELGADIVTGTTSRNQLLVLAKQFLSDHKKINIVKKNIRPAKYEEFGTYAYSENVRAYLKIQDGCDNFCAYCLIPLIRGNSRSRGINETLNEAKILVDSGYEEIIISGIHIGAYGKDLGDGNYHLSNLLEDIILQNPNLKRIRISSIEETEIDEKFLDILNKYKVIVDHLHIPLQSGSSSVLQRMHRKYDTLAFLEKLDKIREIRPNISITTDVIVGFPGETEQEWNETYEFCKKAKFSEIHVFPFSSRPNTAASVMKPINDAVKTKRVEQLLELSKNLNNEYVSKFINKDLEVLFEEFDENTKINKGHTGNYLDISYKSTNSLVGKYQTIHITEDNLPNNF